jgi:hypothetical protein
MLAPWSALVKFIWYPAPAGPNTAFERKEKTTIRVFVAMRQLGAHLRLVSTYAGLHVGLLATPDTET